MIKTVKCNTIIIIISILSISISCAKMEAPDSAPRDSEEAPGYMAVKSKRAMKMDEGKKMTAGATDKKSGEIEMKTGLPSVMDIARDRLLEYRISLTYETDRFLASRLQLIELISKYGFIKGGTTNTGSSSQRMNAELYVRVQKLYQALADFDRLGNLSSESISVNDHTESMFWQKMKVDREQVRISRKNMAMRGIAPAQKSWGEKESSLERSEDSLDRAEFERWKIKDRVAWAKINIFLRGPVTIEKIEVPTYRNAFIGLLNFFLELLYALIWLLPFVATGILIWRVRGRISGFFSRKKSRD